MVTAKRIRAMLQALNRDVLHCWQSVMWCRDRSRKGCLLTVCSLKADLTEDAVVDVLLSDTATSNTSFHNECRDLVTPVTRQSRQLTSGQEKKSTPLSNKSSISCQKLTPQTISPDTKPVRCREDEESTRGLKRKVGSLIKRKKSKGKQMVGEKGEDA